MDKQQYLQNEEYRIKSGQKAALALFLKRDFEMKVRLNSSEKELLDSLCEIYECSRAEYARRAICENHPHKVPTINQSAWVELSKVGSNLNQLAKKLNQNESIEIGEIQELLKVLRGKLIGADFE